MGGTLVKGGTDGHSGPTVRLPEDTPSASLDSQGKSWQSRPLVERSSSILRRYDVTQGELGQGGYGKVYLARDRQYKGRQVAIKVLHKAANSTLDAFRREVQIMKELDHPCIARIFETYEEEGANHVFIVMEYLEGGDLFDRLAEASGKLAVSMVMQVIKQIAGALNYAHKRQIAHRDIKLENICFCSADHTINFVKVIDWGLAQYFRKGKMKSQIGTTTYTAPEVLMQRAPEEGYTCACDIWSLGVLAYIGLSGKPPFWGSTKQVLQRMLDCNFPFAGGIWDEMPAPVKDFIIRCLQPDPSQRLSINQVLQHPCLSTDIYAVEPPKVREVLTNMIEFSFASKFYATCVASVARQLDYQGLRGIHEVFCSLDTRFDGVISGEELRMGFVQGFGDSSEEFKKFDEVFSMLDADGCGEISYTAFCAGGLGDRSFSDEHVLWAAFKSFDLTDEGHIPKDQLQQLLTWDEVTRIWSKKVCDGPAMDALKRMAASDVVTFPDWLTLMREAASLERDA